MMKSVTMFSARKGRTYFCPKFLAVVVLLCLMYPSWLKGQNQELDKMQKEFEDFKKQENSRFEAYREKENRAFANFLRQQWITVPQEKPRVTKPTPPLPTPIPLPAAQSAPVVVPEPTSVPEMSSEPVLPQIQPPPALPVLSVEFYGVSLAMVCPENIKILPAGITESQVSDYWNEMSRGDWPSTVKYFQQVAQDLQLRDWATYLLLKNFSEKVHKESNPQILFQFFFWNQLGYHGRIARSGDELLLLIPSRHMLYGLPYTTLNGNRYFIVAGKGSGSMQTFAKDFSRNNRPLDMAMTEVPRLGSKWNKKVLAANVKSDRVEIQYNLNWMKLLEDMPQIDLDLIFSARVSREVEKDFQKSLEKVLSGKTEEEKVAYLLNFVQQSFAYQTDQEQFGREKYFFVEEVIHYPYSDCEDRSVLFTWLVRKLTGLRVVGLEYDGHVAAAVRFNNPVNGDALDWKGNRYVVCDPTYIGAGIGMTMPSYKGQKFRVIEPE